MNVLTIRSFHVSDVVNAEDHFFLRSSDTRDGSFVLGIPCGDVEEYMASDPLIEDVQISVVSPGQWQVSCAPVMDILPVSVKILGKPGEGITHTLTGVHVLLTGMDTAGNVLCALGGPVRPLAEHMLPGRAGTPDMTDYIVSFAVTVKENAGYSRSGPNACHRAVDLFCQHIRRELFSCRAESCSETHRYEDRPRPGKKKVALVKLVSGQGSMYDTVLFPDEPGGFVGGRSVIDMGCMPVLVTANQCRDGVLRALN